MDVTSGDTRDPRRMIAFADAVVAIALTLLVLPLADIAENLHQTDSVATALRDHLGLIGSFLLTFVLIARLWWIHNQMFAAAVRYDGWILAATLSWLLSIVVLPFGARLVAIAGGDRAAFSVYVGALVVASSSLAVSARCLTRPGYRAQAQDLAPKLLGGTLVSTICLLVILGVGLASPYVGYWSMLVLLLPGVVMRGRRLSGAD